MSIMDGHTALWLLARNDGICGQHRLWDVKGGSCFSTKTPNFHGDGTRPQRIQQTQTPLHKHVALCSAQRLLHNSKPYNFKLTFHLEDN